MPGIEVRAIVLAGPGHERGDDLCIPADGGPDLQDMRFGCKPHVEQGFYRVACLVTRAIATCPVLTCHQRLECQAAFARRDVIRTL
jgi:hypothetical protein